MATIAERVKKDGSKSFQASIRIKGCANIVRTLPTRMAALLFAKDVEARLRDGLELGPTTQRKLTMFELEKEELRDTIAAYRLSPRYPTRYNNIAPTALANIGNVEVGKIDKSWIEAYLTTMRSTNSRAGRPFAWETLVGHMKFMKAAIKWRASMANLTPPPFPFDKKMLPSRWQSKRSRRLLGHEEIALRAKLRLAPAETSAHWLLLLDLALETGARQSEMVMAKWDEFSLENKTWTIPAHATKSDKSRAVPLTIKARSVIEELQRLADVESDRPFHCFPNAQRVSLLFAIHVREAKLVNFRFHDLRHEAISRLVLYKRKLSVYEIMRIVGHSSIEMLNRYANLRTDELADRMD